MVEHTKKTLRPTHFFFLVQIEREQEMEAYQFKSLIDSAVKQTFGSAGSAEPIDILQVENNIAYLRIHANAYNFVTAALCLTHKFEVGNMLHSAIAKNDWKEVQQLLNISYINVDERDKILQTPLHAVCTSGHKELAEVLIQKGADVNLIDTNSWAPIHCAAANSQLEVVDLLLDHPKIDISILSKDGTSIFHYLTRARVEPEKEQEYLKLLAKAKDKGADITLHGKHLETPLHQAAERSNQCAIRFLLKNKANIDAQNKLGETALHYAVRTKDAELITLLLENDADLSIRSRDGTPMDMAGNDEEIKAILEGKYEPTGAKIVKKTRPKARIPVATSPPIAPKSAPVTVSREGKEINEHQKEVQKQMLMQYTTQAYKNGMPSSLPIFCKHCLRPFTYPTGAISIKCPMCLTVNEIK